MNRPPIDIGQMRRHFSAHAAEYDHHAVVQKRVVARLLQLLPKEVPGPILEVGSGTGELSRQLRHSYPDLGLILSDIAHGMTLHAAGAVAGAAALDAEAEALPFRDGSFGLVVSSSVYQWVNDLPRAFAESGRVLAPGGRFVFALFGGRTLFELRESHRLAAAADGGRTSHVQSFPDSSAVHRALACAGFEGVRVRSFDEVEWHADVPTLLRNLKRIGAQNAAGNRPSGLASRRVMQRMLQFYGERFGDGERIPATYEVICGAGCRPG